MADDQTAWRDWLRVEQCINFGLGRWGYAIAAGVVAWQYLQPISSWLMFGAVVVVLGVRSAYAKRDDAKRQRVRKESATSMEPYLSRVHVNNIVTTITRIDPGMNVFIATVEDGKLIKSERFDSLERAKQWADGNANCTWPCRCPPWPGTPTTTP